jgi:hypothetical protein
VSCPPLFDACDVADVSRSGENSVYAPLKAYGAGPGKKVGIIGIGGLGHLGLQVSNPLSGHRLGGCNPTVIYPYHHLASFPKLWAPTHML